MILHLSLVILPCRVFKTKKVAPVSTKKSTFLPAMVRVSWGSSGVISRVLWGAPRPLQFSSSFMCATGEVGPGHSGPPSFLPRHLGHSPFQWPSSMQFAHWLVLSPSLHGGHGLRNAGRLINVTGSLGGPSFLGGLSSFAFTSRSWLLNTRSADSTSRAVGMVGPLPNFCNFLTMSGALWDLRVACPSNGFRLYLRTVGDTPLGTQGRLGDFPPVPGWLPVPYFNLWVSFPLTKPLRNKSLKCVRFCQLFSSWWSHPGSVLGMTGAPSCALHSFDWSYPLSPLH